MNDDRYYRNQKSDTFFAFVTGIALGAVAVFMSNPDNRERVRKTFGDVQKKGQKMLDETTRKVEKGVETVGNRAKQLAEDAEDTAKRAQRELTRRQSRT